MSLQVRRVNYQQVDDGQGLLAVLDAYAQDPMGGGQSLTPFVRANLLTQLARMPTAMSWLAWHDAEPVGLVNAFLGFSTFQCRPLLNIHDLAVKPAWRGQGIAKALLYEVEAEAQRLGCCKLTLEVLSANLAAQQLYRKLGFAAYQLKSEAGQALFWQKVLVPSSPVKLAY